MTFVQLCASKFRVDVQMVGVDDVCTVEPIMRVTPTGALARGLIFLGCWIGQHFVAIVDAVEPEPRAGEHMLD